MEEYEEYVNLQKEQDAKRITIRCWRHPEEFKKKINLRLGSLDAGNNSQRLLNDLFYLLNEGLKRNLISRSFYDNALKIIDRS